jgi:hypothetical protein
MLKSLLDEIFGGVPEEFAAAGSPEEAARRLAEETPRRFAATVGRVSVEHVVLRRSRSRSNGFEFRGRFVVESGRTLLRGRFQLAPSVQAFHTLWFGAVAWIPLHTFVHGVEERGASWWSGVAVGAACGLLFGLFGFGLLRLNKSLSRTDNAKIRQHIKMALERG